MKKIPFIFCFVLGLGFSQAQDVYTVDGNLLELKTEVEGKLDLLWNIIDGKYRYFIRTEDNTITELTNTKVDGRFQDEYKTQLEELTNNSMSTKRLKLTLFSLKEFVDKYNSSVDSTYETQTKRNKLMFRLGVFGGITNSPFITNPENETTTLLGGEFEVLDIDRVSRHAAFMQFKHVLEYDDLPYSTSEISLGYRFRFINAEKFSLYGNCKFATVNFSDVTVFNEIDGEIVSEDISETAFDVPFIFGVGADINVTKGSFITLAFNEIFALFLENRDNFSKNLTIGYKFNL